MPYLIIQTTPPQKKIFINEYFALVSYFLILGTAQYNVDFRCQMSEQTFLFSAFVCISHKPNVFTYC